MTDALVPTSDMGAALVEEAKKSRHKKLSDQCLSDIEEVIGQIAHLENRIAENSRRLDVFKRRLAAIEAGQIIFQYNQSTGRMAVTYVERELQPAIAGC